MAAAKGNTYRKGKPNPNAGRKSMREEYNEQQRLLQLTRRQISLDELRNIVNNPKKKLDFLERMVLAGSLGREKTGIAVFNKIMPDKIEFDNPKEREEIQALKNEIKSWFSKK